MAKQICRIMGAVFILVGLLGYVMPNLLGMHLSPTHNIIHLLSGAAALYFGFAGTYSAARTFCLAFGGVYLLLGVLGFIAPAAVADLLNAHHVTRAADSLLPDNLVHLLLGIVFLAGGLARNVRTTPFMGDSSLPHGH